ncbi:MAG TPA: type II secretion protein F, partial [Thermoplasmata archaeon]|nr:type II secretion protein F [Thermoplasmata archaeon]
MPIDPKPKDVAAVAGVRTVRLKRGEQPTHSPLTPFEAWAWKTFRGRVTNRPPDPLLDEQLLKAHIRIRGDEYLAKVYATTVVAVIALAVVGVVLAVFLNVEGLAFLGIALGVALPVLGGVGSFFGLKGAPGGKAKSRGKAIDRKISSSMSFVSAMASADVNIDAIFKELARQKIYGEVAEEAAWITRDTELLGLDILTAIRNGASRTPSKRFQDFLQGVVTT